MNKNKRIYLVAKVSGLPAEVVKAKYDRARDIVESYGYTAVRPIDHVTPATPWHEAMRICIPLMLECDGYANIDDPHTSPGALVETTVAGWVKLPHFSFIEF